MFRFSSIALIQRFCFLALLVHPDLLQAQTYDTPGPQIQIEVNIYEYRLNSDKQLGIFYEFNADRNEDGLLEGEIGDSEVFLPGTENVADNPIGALDLTGSFAKLNFGSIDFNLKAAIQNGRATIISNPTIITSDGQQAQIISGEEVPLTVLEVKGNNTKLKTETRPTGIKLIVTPRIFARNYVMMNLEIESSEITRFQVFDRGDQQRFELPVVTKRNLKTVVIVPSEQQIYIGGLYTNNTGDTVRKIPIAGDLPGLGFFLRGFNKRKDQSETVFQITPTIQAPGKGLSTEDTIFEDLLHPENVTLQPDDLINQPKPKEPIEETVPLDGDDSVSNATETIFVPSKSNEDVNPQFQNPSRSESSADQEKDQSFRFEGSKPGR